MSRRAAGSLTQSIALLLAALTAGAPGAGADARGDCFARSGDAAILACTEAIARDPRDAVSHVNRAYEHLQKGDHARSIADYTRAIEIDPSRGDAYQGRAWALLKAGRAAEALTDADAALKLKPGDARSLDTRGHVLEALGRREEAIAEYRRALAVEPRLQGSRDGLRRLGALP
jgi:tetratricopeptide (TPR) repeat protein